MHELLPTLNQYATDTLTALYEDHKVCTVVAERLDDCGEMRSLSQRLQPTTATMARRHGETDEVLELLKAVGREASAEMSLIKGLASQRLYDEPRRRHIGDFDVYVATVKEAWSCAVALLARGFDFAPGELPWFKRDDDVTYGQIRLGRLDKDLWIDIHFGYYSVRNCARLEVSAPAGDGAVPAEENIPMMVANAAGDCFTTLKDLNDLYLAVTVGGVDWDDARRRIRSARLDGYFNGMLKRLETLFDLGDRRSAVRELRFPRAYEPRPSLLQPSWTGRCLLTTWHTWRVTARSPLRRRGIITREAWRYYRRPLAAPLVTKTAPAVRLRPETLTSWICVRAVPVEILGLSPQSPPWEKGNIAQAGWQITDGVEVVSLDDMDILIADGKVLIPTVYGSISERQVNAALRRHRYAVTD